MTELHAVTADGERVSAVLRRERHEPGSLELLWSAERVWRLFPEIGTTGTAGMDALLRAWRAELDTESPGEDSACVVTWPSHDAEAIRAFLDHGLAPVTALATRTGPPDTFGQPGVTVRQARPDDFAAVLDLALEVFDYSALVALPRREHTEELLAPRLRAKLAQDTGTVWVAEVDGLVAGLADCSWVDVAGEAGAGELLPPGSWGYLNNVGTAREVRGHGIGRTLAAAAHAYFHERGAAGTYLYYNPPNPLSSVFWHRRGYRPLWTIWEVRPASLLR
ncbi:GNAT family N-acetyltransferase [Amycolatopsis sp. 195334CR]|uniref:GNAT family N-acetyltransferase n=1 Tax=Amycolatopsis sp. 195334CR TaxID=2814588 RepID=UPI001A8C77E0|nr:GNAT family N-acetyltransferase [Amycolatopsis sp. 195334CR]MBN6038557.1 GNAT family N-acetyltransferase [Amycolatopsis sp. 195334CR]